MNKDLFDYCFRQTQTDPTGLDVMEFLRTTQASFGSWTHKTWVKFHVVKTRRLLWQWNASDDECFDRMRKLGTGVQIVASLGTSKWIVRNVTTP